MGPGVAKRGGTGFLEDPGTKVPTRSQPAQDPLLRHLLWTPGLTSPPNGPQLLLPHWRLLRLRWLLHLQSLQMHLLQEE
ncbi:uncharacterized protein LOC101286953 isoform X2 [Orcinus orca]|uniref:uncharacterized protein LOC101286953 isoform X1 n=1 Tax=Orcinus orca TaxID=9733 RepID=UPI0021125AB4|nr:uncharacterized protein LOC101286953 isoform X1 [Orcinus orca]XP_049558759.1 uncharacterized protein LOC101286953 isoform X2 [Orcinus orca]